MAEVWVRAEIMGSQKCRIVGKYQSVLIMIDPIIFTRTRTRGDTLGIHQARAWPGACVRACVRQWDEATAAAGESKAAT
eukprot:COSAG01_NODE_4688_length_4811_cov_3.539588_1_plen_79_part_00